MRGGKAVRRADQTEFLARDDDDFNATMVRFLRDELGAKQLINAGKSWKTGSTELLNDAERWSYTAADVDAANVYNGGIHKGPKNGWATAGDQFTNESILRTPRSSPPIHLKQTQGRPMLLTELGILGDAQQLWRRGALPDCGLRIAHRRGSRLVLHR